MYDDLSSFNLGGTGTGVADPWSNVPYDVGSYRDPQASYYSPGIYDQPSGEASAQPRSYSQVPGTSGAPNETASAYGGVNTGAGTGSRIPYGGLAGGTPRDWRSNMRLAQLGMQMMAPPRQQQTYANPYANPYASPYGMNYAQMAQMLSMMQRPIPQMQHGGFPRAGQPVLVGENGPEVFVPQMPGSIVPNNRIPPWALNNMASVGNAAPPVPPTTGWANQPNVGTWTPGAGMPPWAQGGGGGGDGGFASGTTGWSRQPNVGTWTPGQGMPPWAQGGGGGWANRPNVGSWAPGAGMPPWAQKNVLP